MGEIYFISFLNVNAFNYYRFGVIRGTVTNISKSPDQDAFVVLASLNENPSIPLKNGFKVGGDIILEKVKLFKFVLTRMFSKV